MGSWVKLLGIGANREPDVRELIKLKVLESSMYNAREASVKLAEATGADCVQVIGSKFVLYLQKKKDSAYADLLK